MTSLSNQLISTMTRSALLTRASVSYKGGRKKKYDSDWIWIIAIGLGVGLLHSAYLHVLFEKDRFFSHLSTLERELSFRTEMGLYYSYYKTIVNAPSFYDGLHLISHDNLTEYPSTINTLQRFNLYPEVFMGGIFRTWQALLKSLGTSGVECSQISRGYQQPPITACNGLGDATYFYVWCVFALNGFMASIIFILGTYLSDSLLGGLLSLVSFFFNHGEATRVMWTPPLRESFAMPFLLFQILSITYCIRQQTPTLFHYMLVVSSSLAYLLPWQFSQFTLLTQTLSLFLLHSLRLLPPTHLIGVFLSLAIALLFNVFLQFGNTLLLTSLLPLCIISCLMVVKLQYVYDLISCRIIKMFSEVLTVLVLMFSFKLAVNWLVEGVDDAHIFSIFLSKFTSYHDFHTRLYTCSPEFDFLPLEYPLRLTLTLLLPAGLVVAILVFYSLVQHLINSTRHGGSLHSHSIAEQTYHLIQCLAFLILAILIMRLKLFLTPYLCLIVALLARPKFCFSRVSPSFVVGLLIFGGSFKGIYNIWTQWNVFGEFNNPELEEMVKWINGPSLPEHAVFAGAMPTMAALRLTTSRPIVNHPHYEDTGIRSRTMLVYSIYSRKTPLEVHRALGELRVTHVVVESSWCTRRYQPGCSFAEVWDEDDPVNQDRPQFCQLILDTMPTQFELVFSNHVYIILKLK